MSVREGQHDGLISFETYQRIQDNLEGKKRAPAARKDYHVDFPLRGFVACNCCGNAMTAAWSTGCRKRYAYYRCETRGCEEKSKGIPRANMEEAFEGILQSLTPSRKLFGLVKAKFADAWEMRSAQAHAARDEWKRQLKDAEKQVEGLIDRLVDTENRTVARKREERIDALERQKLVLAEKAAKELPTKASLGDRMQLTLKFLSSPRDIYRNGTHLVQQTVHRFCLCRAPEMLPKNKYRTIIIPPPVRSLGAFTGLNGEMVL